MKLFKVNEIRQSVYHFKFADQYSLTSTFMRIQEHYESPYRGIHEKHFTHEEFMNKYFTKTGDMSYFTDFVGFNIPSYSIRKFIKMYQYKHLWDKEIELILAIKELPEYRQRRKFYIIATFDQDDTETLNHEIAHSYWHLHDEYKKSMKAQLNLIPVKLRKKIKESLKKEKYCASVLDDEIHAYASTATKKYFRESEHFEGFIKVNLKPFRSIFKKMDRKYTNEMEKIS